MPINNVKSFTKVGRGDVFLLAHDGSYEITTVGALGGSSDVHVWETTVEIGSNDDLALTDNWNLLHDTGASGEADAVSVASGARKLFVDVIDGDEGVVVTLVSTRSLSSAFDKSPGILDANNQRQKFSSQVRRVN